MIDVSKIDWDAFKADLQIARQNEHLWALGSSGDSAEIHMDNENRILDEIISIENGDYESVISNYEEEVFNDYIIR